MTTDCIDNVSYDVIADHTVDHANDKTVHDAVFAAVISILFVVPATLAALSLIA